MFNPDRRVVERVFTKELQNGYSVEQLPLAFIEYRG